MSNLLAYHLTVGTYGSRLHGDERGTVDRQHNEYQTPVLESDPRRCDRERSLLKQPPVTLTDAQRAEVERLVPVICQRGKWLYHIAACQPDHLHLLLSADLEGKAVRKWLKRWLSEELTQQWPARKTWWVECGSIKHIWDERYFNEVHRYILEQRFTPFEPNPGTTGSSPRNTQVRAGLCEPGASPRG